MPLTDAGRRLVTEGWRCALFDDHGKVRTGWLPVNGDRVDFGLPKVSGPVFEARVHTPENEELVFPLDMPMWLTPSCSVSLMLGVGCSA